jgi:biotin operon repressor
MFNNKKDLQDIQRRLNHIEANINKVIWMLREQPEKTVNDYFVEQFESEVEGAYKRLAKEKKAYPWTFIACVNGRYKTVDEICNELKLTESSVRTYLKHARKDGIEFNTRRSGKKLSYKVRKI